MKFVALFSLVILSLFANAQDSNPSSPPAGRGRHASKAANASSDQEQKAKNTISGQCVVLAGEGNIETSPCVNLTLKLDAENGKDILTTRTTSNGVFEFSAPADGKYKLTATSRFYEVVWPTESISGTKRITLQLKQK